MKQIIELAQELFSKEQSVLSELQNDKEYALNEALKRQSEIPVQEAKVEALAKDLQDLYTRYGYADSDNGVSVSPAKPEINKGVKPGSFKTKGPQKIEGITLEDLRKKILRVGYSKGKSALEAVGVERLSDVDENEYPELMGYLNGTQL